MRTLALLAVVLGAACWVEPVQAPPPVTPMPQPPPPTVAAPAPTPATAVIVAAVPETPFAAGQAWTGRYVCAQGITDLVVRIQAVQGNLVQAVFAFHHVPTGAAGEYELGGSWDPTSRVADLVPGAWIVQPPGYVTVGMRGTVAANGVEWSGTIQNPSCGSFSLQRTQ